MKKELMEQEPTWKEIGLILLLRYWFLVVILVFVSGLLLFSYTWDQVEKHTESYVELVSFTAPFGEKGDENWSAGVAVQWPYTYRYEFPKGIEIWKGIFRNGRLVGSYPIGEGNMIELSSCVVRFKTIKGQCERAKIKVFRN